MKSDVDLTAKHGRHKVAKFILGAANRDPAKAAKRFGGHAVMLLGVSPAVTAGIPPFEAQDLEREIRKFTGASGPGWDFERIKIAGQNDVIAIIVDPPTARIWPCLADGEGMSSGDIYIRGDGRTEKATGGEIQAMLARISVRESVELPEITVEVVGEVTGVQFDSERIVTWVKEVTEEYLHDVGAPSSSGPFGILAHQGLMEQRSESAFRRQVEQWKSTSLADPASGLHDIAARVSVGVQLRVTNPVAMSLRDVRIDIEFDDSVRALQWEDPDRDDRLDLFPDRPLAWGRHSLADVLRSTNIAPFVARDSDGILQIRQSSPAKFSLSLTLLRAKEVRLTEADDIVLVLLVEDHPPDQVSARWQLTAGDVHDLREGTLTVPVSRRNWTGVIAEMLDGRAAEETTGDQ
ncbi:hypothetical protein ACPW96_22730 [Micromonospora sp. DT81.3]|uniref:hypothetical protein n=1 Tax=Micromonospora sp. DT81.3 TaxID=3416523 RepID=UPI003CFB178D